MDYFRFLFYPGHQITVAVLIFWRSSRYGEILTGVRGNGNNKTVPIGNGSWKTLLET